MNSLNALCALKPGSLLCQKKNNLVIVLKTNLNPDFSSLWRIHLNVNDVQRLLGLPGHGGLAGDGLAVGVPERLDEGAFFFRHVEDGSCWSQS